MTISFKDYLMEVEQSLSFDPEKETPAEIANRVKQAHRVSRNAPERAIRTRQQNLKKKTDDIKKDKDDPLAKERLQIKSLEDRIARQKMILARKEKGLGK